MIFLSKKNLYTKNLENPTKEIYKSVNWLSTPIIKKEKQLDRKHLKKLLTTSESFSFYLYNRKTAKFATKTITYTGPQVWNLIPENIRNTSSFNAFRKKIKNWNDDLYSCRICKPYIQPTDLI